MPQSVDFQKIHRSLVTLVAKFFNCSRNRSQISHCLSTEEERVWMRTSVDVFRIRPSKKRVEIFFENPNVTRNKSAVRRTFLFLRIPIWPWDYIFRGGMRGRHDNIIWRRNSGSASLFRLIDGFWRRWVNFETFVSPPRKLASNCAQRD